MRCMECDGYLESISQSGAQEQPISVIFKLIANYCYPRNVALTVIIGGVTKEAGGEACKPQFLAHSEVIFNEKDKQQFKPCSFIVRSQLLILWEKKWTQSVINYPLPLKLCMDVGARTVTNHILTNIGFKRFKGSLPYSLSNFTKICSLCFF